jgi:hypothetical protein
MNRKGRLTHGKKEAVEAVENAEAVEANRPVRERVTGAGTPAPEDLEGKGSE